MFPNYINYGLLKNANYILIKIMFKVSLITREHRIMLSSNLKRNNCVNMIVTLQKGQDTRNNSPLMGGENTTSK